MDTCLQICSVASLDTIESEALESQTCVFKLSILACLFSLVTLAQYLIPRTLVRSSLHPLLASSSISAFHHSWRSFVCWALSLLLYSLWYSFCVASHLSLCSAVSVALLNLLPLDTCSVSRCSIVYLDLGCCFRLLHSCCYSSCFPAVAWFIQSFSFKYYCSKKKHRLCRITTIMWSAK